MSKRNDIKLYTDLGFDNLVSHFKLSEFENHDGFVMVHPGVLKGLELVRRDLSLTTRKAIYIIISCCVRTHKENEELAARLGWTDEGGLVSRTSKHLPEYGGIAVDFTAFYTDIKEHISRKLVGGIARRHFDFVKDTYSDGHIHADQREG